MLLFSARNLSKKDLKELEKLLAEKRWHGSRKTSSKRALLDDSEEDTQPKRKKRKKETNSFASSCDSESPCLDQGEEAQSTSGNSGQPQHGPCMTCGFEIPVCKLPHKNSVFPTQQEVLALDCEFVGVGPRKVSALGRCSIVGYDGKVLLDVYARPREPITDYRTRWSGIRRWHMWNAIPAESAQSQIARLIKGKVIVGHALSNDFNVLEIHHPSHLVRDTSACNLLRDRLAIQPCRNNVSLKALTSEVLGRAIQCGSHCSVEDARAAMDLYRLVEQDWEAELQLTQHQRLTEAGETIHDLPVPTELGVSDSSRTSGSVNVHVCKCIENIRKCSSCLPPEAATTNSRRCRSCGKENVALTGSKDSAFSLSAVGSSKQDSEKAVSNSCGGSYRKGDNSDYSGKPWTGSGQIDCDSGSPVIIGGKSAKKSRVKKLKGKLKPAVSDDLAADSSLLDDQYWPDTHQLQNI